MARYKLTLVYDGTDFFGSQRLSSSEADPGARRRTVQGELEKALCTLGWTGRSVLMSGRTDTGVHARGQVAAVDLDWSHSSEELVRALNAALPADMAVHQARVVHQGFHPRFEALSRHYRYRLYCQPLRDPIRDRFAWRLWPPVRSEVLTETAKFFPGVHDFSAFGSPTRPGGSTVRTVLSAEWFQTEEDEWCFDVQADAFLYRMVRRLVFLQVAAARGKVSAETISRALVEQPSAGSEKLPGGLAPAHGLTLVEVAYRDQESIDPKEVSFA